MANGLVLIGLQSHADAPADRDALLVVDGLPGLRDQRAQAGAAQLLLQLHLRRLPGVPRPGLASTTSTPPRRSPTGRSRCSMAPWGRVPASQYLLRLIKLAADKYKINLKLPFARAAPKRTGPAALRPAAGRGRHAPAFMASSPICAANLDETKSEGYREYMMQYMSATRVPPLPRQAAAPGVARRDDSHRRSRAHCTNGDRADFSHAHLRDFTAFPLDRALWSARGPCTSPDGSS